jgi:malonate transporter and related proteins
MSATLSVILPVFLVLAAGWLTAKRGILSEPAIDGLMKFAQGIAVPCLLFRAISTLDLGAHFDLTLLLSFYGGALAGFATGLLGARFLFKRGWEDAVAIGFVGLFSNSLLLGLPITERAFGADALAANYAIIAIHAPFCYLVGISTMELVRAGGAPLSQLPGKIGRAMAGNALVIGIALGFVVNLTALPLPLVLTDGIDLIARAGLPTALFGLGGVLTRYRPEGDLPTILFIVAVSLVLHPTVVWLLGTATALPQDAFRSAVITAAMAPGVNAYLFADMYGRARRVAASAVLVGTVACMATAALWLVALP